uniref:Uncharacterized protein n=1 Tax=Cuerna arida TaxID=1464854 RepID=A0A1B6ENL1_9HEMI
MRASIVSYLLIVLFVTSAVISKPVADNSKENSSEETTQSSAAVTKVDSDESNESKESAEDVKPVSDAAITAPVVGKEMQEPVTAMASEMAMEVRQTEADMVMETTMASVQADEVKTVVMSELVAPKMANDVEAQPSEIVESHTAAEPESSNRRAMNEEPQAISMTAASQGDAPAVTEAAMDSTSTVI